MTNSDVLGSKMEHYQESLIKVGAAIAAKAPLIWVITNEEQRFCDSLYDFTNSVKSQKDVNDLWIKMQMYTWDAHTGVLPYQTKQESFFGGEIPLVVQEKFKNTQKPADALAKFKAEKFAEGKNALVMCMLDLHLMMEPPVQRLLKNWLYNRRNHLNEGEKKPRNPTIILVGPEFGIGQFAHKMPATLAVDVPVIYLDLPDRKIVDNVLSDHLNTWDAKIKKLGEDKDKKKQFQAFSYTPEERNNILGALSGLTTVEMKRILTEIVTRYPFEPIDPNRIVEEKKLILQRDGILEPIKPNVTMDDVAGLDLVKKYFTAYKAAFTEEAQNFGVVPPRGVLFVGVPGGGKSLFAKAIASYYKMPLLRMDIGKLFNSLVGSSEARTREALKQAEAFGTAILWVDEIEKGLSGTQSSGQTDGGTTSRVFGTILTWMQEHEANIIVIATANDVAALPPELLRRFNEIFFVDLPTDEEREDVFRILLKHKKRELKKFDVTQLLKASDKFTGAEIEKAIVEALAQAYTDKLDKKCKDLETSHLVDALNATRPIAVVQPERISKLRDWAKARARFASSKAWDLVTGKKVKAPTTTTGESVDLDSVADDLLV